ncbi:MAG TPA: hypothetical protein DEP72_01150 [Clostridiales bacterium]|nr:MAG: hypothetical protein A2Y18_01815 [Clostridiales bacterium GWD2_32_19]HCC06760.1 hypothetical protein [Clostridiales bacterium]
MSSGIDSGEEERKKKGNGSLLKRASGVFNKGKKFGKDKIKGLVRKQLIKWLLAAGWPAVAVLVIFVFLVLVIQVPSASADIATKNIEKLYMDFSEEPYLIEEIDIVQKAENKMTPKTMEKYADLFIMYRGAMEGDTDDVATKKIKDNLTDALREQGILANTIDEIPFFLKFERESYAWSYPKWEPITNATEKKIFDMYSNIYRKENVAGNGYIIRDMNGNVKKKIYTFHDLSSSDIYDEYKKTFSKEDIVLKKNNLFKGTHVAVTDPSVKKQILKKQFDMLYNNVMTKYEKYFKLMQKCDEAYFGTYNDKFISTDENENMVYLANADGDPLEVYMRRSLINRFLIFNEVVRLVYEMTGYPLNTATTDNDLKYNDADVQDMIKKGSYKKSISRSYTDTLLDLQEIEYKNRLSWHYIGSVLAEKAKKEDEIKLLAGGKSGIPETVNLKKELDEYNVLNDVLSTSTPYFKYVYPSNMSALVKENDTKVGIMAKYGDEYEDFDIKDGPCAPIIPREMFNGEYKTDNTDFPAGYIEINEEEIKDKLSDMNDLDSWLSNIIKTMKAFEKSPLVYMKEEFIPMALVAYNARNHEISEAFNVLDYYVTHKLHMDNSSEELYAYDSWSDGYQILRDKEVKYHNIIVSDEELKSKGDVVNITETIRLEYKCYEEMNSQPDAVVANNILRVNRQVSRTLPSLKADKTSNIFYSKVNTYSESVINPMPVVEEDLDKTKSYVEHIDKHWEAYNYEGEPPELEPAGSGDAIDAELIYHNIYNKPWTVMNGSKSK